MTFLTLFPAAVSLLLIAAHFLRYGYYPLVIAALIVIGLLFLRHPFSGRIVQTALIGAACQWAWTTIELIDQRSMAGAAYLRMSIILFSVVVFTGFAAVLLSTRRSRAWFADPVPSHQLHPSGTIS